MSFAGFPNVPNVPGVPPLPRDPSILDTIVQLATTDIVDQPGLEEQQWGLFQNGQPIVVADTVTAFEYKQEWSVMNYPIEQGAFETYNKVQVPFSARVRYSMGGAEQDRQALLQSIQDIAGTLEKYDLYTPEVFYSPVNVTHYDYKRTAREGVGLVQIDVWVVEIRENSSTAFANTQAPSGASPVGNGLEQARPPSLTDNIPAPPSPSSSSSINDPVPFPSWWQ